MDTPCGVCHSRVVYERRRNASYDAGRASSNAGGFAIWVFFWGPIALMAYGAIRVIFGS